MDPRTLVASLERGTLSVRMRVALDHMFISGETSLASRQRERTEALEREMAVMKKSWEEWETALAGTIAEEVRVAVEAAKTSLGEEFSRAVVRGNSATVHLSEAAQVEAGQGEVDGPKNQGPRPARSHRLSRGWSPGSPIPGKRTPTAGGMESVTEWRERVGRRGEGTKLEQARNRERIMELEIEMIGS